MNTPTESWENGLYAKWKAEHGDVAHPTIVDGFATGTAPEWYVRNYVDTRLLPYISSLLASQKQDMLDGLEEGLPPEETTGWDGRDFVEIDRTKSGWNKLRLRVLTLINSLRK